MRPYSFAQSVNIYSKVAIVTTGLALLGSVGTALAAAADFALSGSFTNNGYFNGIYSIDDSASYGPNNSDPNQNQGGLVATLSQFDINLFSTPQSKLGEISSTNPNWLVKEKFFNPSMGVWGLTLVNPSIQAKFFLLFAGAAPTPQTQQGAVFL